MACGPRLRAAVRSRFWFSCGRFSACGRPLLFVRSCASRLLLGREAGDSETKRSDDVRAWRQSFSTGNSTPSSRRDVRSTYKRQRQARTARDKSPRDCKAVRTFGRRRTRVREIARPVRTFGLRRLEAVQALGLGRFRARNQICGARKLKPRPRRSHSKALEP